MKKMITSLLIFFGVIFIVGWLITANASSILSAYLSAKLHVNVAVKKLSLHPQGATIHGFRIKNPEGSPLKNGFTAKTIDVHMKWAHLLQNPIHIDSVTIDDVYVSLLLPKKQKIACNWVKIFKGLEKEKTYFRKSEREFVIDSLLVTGLRVELYTPGKKNEMVGPIKSLQIDDIRSGSGRPLKTFTRAIMSEMMKKIYSLQSIQKAISGFLLLPVEIFQFIFKPSPGDKDPCGEIYGPKNEQPKTPDPGSFPSAGSQNHPGD